MVREISFVADVTEYFPEHNVEFTQKKIVTFLVHVDQQTLILKSIKPCEED